MIELQMQRWYGPLLRTHGIFEKYVSIHPTLSQAICNHHLRVGQGRHSPQMTAAAAHRWPTLLIYCCEQQCIANTKSSNSQIYVGRTKHVDQKFNMAALLWAFE